MQRLAALAVALLAVQTSAQPVSVCTAFPYLPQCHAAAKFSFAAGSGLGTACSGSAVTGAKGEAVTFTRASRRSCLKGAEVIGIKGGDMVTLTSNQPAAQPGGAGTGALGLSMWPARVNSTIKSKKFDAAQWTLFGTFTPSLAADVAFAPDGTQTADHLTFPATAAGQRSFVYQDSACRIGTDSASVFVAAFDGGSGTLDICIDDGATGWRVYSCPYGLTSAGGALGVAADGGPLYTRCMFENFPLSAEGTNMLYAIGNCTNVSGIARNTNDVLLWGAQCEIGVNASPFIDTDLDAGTRAAEVATVSYVAAGTGIGMAATYTPAGMTNDFTGTLTMSFDSANWAGINAIGAKDMCQFALPDAGTHDGGSSLNGVSSFLVSAPSTASCEYTPSTITACSGGYCMAASATQMLQAGTATLYLGGQLDGGAAEGTVKSICVDPSSRRCRPSSALVTCPSDEPSTVAVVGDSIMVGAFQIHMLDEMRNRLCPVGKAAVSYAVSGSTISDCQSQYTTSVKGHAYRAVATNCGINTLNGNGDPSATWALMEPFLNDITRDGGFHVVLGNLTPCRGYSNCGKTDYSNVALFNVMEANWCADAGSRATCLDNYTLLGTGSLTYSGTVDNAGQMGNLCLPSSDDLHPNNYCTTKLADAFAAGVP